MAEAATQLQVQGPPAELEREPLVRHQRSLGWISDQVASIAEGKTPAWWWAAFIPSFLAMSMLGAMLVYQITVGVGVYGPSAIGNRTFPLGGTSRRDGPYVL